MKRTFQPNKLKRRRKIGFMERNSSSYGRRVIKRKKLKGRKVVAIK